MYYPLPGRVIHRHGLRDDGGRAAVGWQPCQSARTRNLAAGSGQSGFRMPLMAGRNAGRARTHGPWWVTRVCGFGTCERAPPLSGAGAFRAPAGSRISARTHASDGRYCSASRRRTRPSRWPLRSKTFQPPGLPVAGGPAKTPATGLGSAPHPHPARFRASGRGAPVAVSFGEFLSPGHAVAGMSDSSSFSRWRYGNARTKAHHLPPPRDP